MYPWTRETSAYDEKLPTCRPPFSSSVFRPDLPGLLYKGAISMNAVEERNVIPMPMSEIQQSSHTPPPAPVQEVANLGNLEKIREILFGAQMREYDRRFARLEERLLKEASEAREDSRRRFETLEHFIKQEVAALGERLRAENQQRSQSSEEITRELRDTSRNLWQKINQLDEQSSNTHRELRQQILDQS